jgi:GNAT superfamily N-acetyltransferase
VPRDEVVVGSCDPAAPAAQAMNDALWAEIQQRYGFEAPNPASPDRFAAPGGFWVATLDGEPVGSVALTVSAPGVGELDVMYVTPSRRGTGVAAALLGAAEDHARAQGMTSIRLRAGEPQPEALRFYAKHGYLPVPPFGAWRDDPTARCFEKPLIL